MIVLALVTDTQFPISLTLNLGGLKGSDLMVGEKLTRCS